MYIGVIIGPYDTDKNAPKRKGDVFVFNVVDNKTYKLGYKLKP